MKWILLAASAAAIGSCAPKDKGLLTTTPVAETASQTNVTAPPSVEGLPAGDYKLDPAHATLLFRISHLGFSHFTGWFDTFSADLKLDPAHPETASLTATVDPASLTVHAPPKGFQEELRAEKFLDAKQFPQITFKSTSVAMKGVSTADVTGDLTFHGVTKPVTLTVTFNGGYAGHVYEPQARIGFSAHGTMKRADFGVSNGIPQPGSNMGVSDELEVIIEAEFIGPAWKDAPKPEGTAPAPNNN